MSYAKRKKSTGCSTDFDCPNPYCKRKFKSQSGLTRHYLNKSTGCYKFNETVNPDDFPGIDPNDYVDETNFFFEDDNNFQINANEDDEEENEVLSATSSSTENSMDNPHLKLGRKHWTKYYGVSFTDSMYAETKLLKLLNDANTPHFLFKDMLNWAAETNSSRMITSGTSSSRDAAITKLEKWQNLERCRPKKVSITLEEDNLTIDVVSFDFISQFYTLVSDPLLVADISQLDVNPDSPFTKYNASKHLSCFNSGQWYQDAWDNCCKNEDDWLCPLIFGCDETLVGSHLGRASITPLVFTLSIFTEELRAKASSRRILGFVYDLTKHAKPLVASETFQNKQRKISTDEKQRRYHKILSVILESLVKVQQEGGFHGVDITLGNYQKKVNVKVPVGMILGDMQGGDKHCNSCVGYSIHLARLCRQCNVSGIESGDPLVQCKKISMRIVKGYYENNQTEMLKKISQYNAHCAWFDVDFGGCKYGIFSAAMPVEALHSLEGGLIKDVLEILYTEDLKESFQQKFDQLASGLCKLDKQYNFTQGSNKSMPRTLFNEGVTSLAKMAHSYYVGVMLTVLIVSLTDDGRALLLEAFDKNGHENPGKRLNDMRYVFSMLLCYWSWLKKTTFWKPNDREARRVATRSIRKMLEELIRLWPRGAGNGWFKPKVHEQLHVPRDIEWNGSPRQSYSGPLEHNHIFLKDLSERTQRVRETLDMQLATRAHESFVIDYCYNKMQFQKGIREKKKNNNCGDDKDEAISYNSSKCTVRMIKKPKGQVDLHYTWTTNCGKRKKNRTIEDLKFDGMVDRYLKNYFREKCVEDPQLMSLEVMLVTEYNREGVVFRAHPSYRNKLPWHDWVMIRYEKGDEDIRKRKSYILNTSDRVYFGDDPKNVDFYHYAPGKILAFMREKNTTDLLAIAMCCHFKHQRSGPITTYWQIEYPNKSFAHPSVLGIGVDLFVRHCMMVPDNDTINGYHEIWDRDRWADEFS